MAIIGEVTLLMFLFTAITTSTRVIRVALMAISTDVIVPGNIQVWSIT